MAKLLSPKIKFNDESKLPQVNPETIKLWNKYQIDMSIRDLSPDTIRAYHNDLTHLWIYTLEHFDNIPISELSEDELTEFFYYCKTEGNNSRRMKRRMSSISAFFKFLRKKRIIDENPMEFIDRPKKDVDVITQTFLTKDQVYRMKITLEKAFNDANSLFGKHSALSNWCYALFSLSTMARVNAVSNTRWEQIDFENRVVNDVLEKEGKIVTLYFSVEVKNLLLKLKDFRTENNINDNGYVFVTKTKGEYKKASKGALSQWAKKIGSSIGVMTLHPHDFRHSQATLFKEAGMPLEDIAILLNHESTETTNQFYIKRNNSQVVIRKDSLEV